MSLHRRITLVATDESDAISSIQVETVIPSAGHWTLTIWNRGGLAGKLVVLKEDGQAIVNRLLPPNKRHANMEWEDFEE